MLAMKFGGIAVIGLFILLLVANKIEHKANEVVKERGSFAAFAKKFALFDQLKANYDAVQDNIAKLENAVPTLDNITAPVDYINTVAIKTSNIMKIKYGTSVSANELMFNEFAFTAQLTGNMQTVTNFLKELEKAPYLIEIKNVSLSFEDNSLEGKLGAVVTGAIYVQQ